MPHSKDLFDDTTMTFGEHLEALRGHLWKAILGLLVCVIASLHPSVAQRVIDLIRMPLDQALADYGAPPSAESGSDFFDGFLRTLGLRSEPEPSSQSGGDSGADAGDDGVAQTPEPPPEPTGDAMFDALKRDVYDLRNELSELRAELHALTKQLRGRLMPQTLNVQEAFMIYLKVAFVSGLVVASPWVFYQLWLFVAAGLYPHERRYVYIYLPISLLLFAVGAVFCFFAVFPVMLKFLLGFNEWMKVVPNIRLSEWLGFAIMLPVIFGLSFELPLVMVFLERISVFSVEDYREKRRLAILGISIVAMVITPTADPLSMLMMMFPLLLLYELGILMCRYSPSKSPFGAEAA